MSGAACGTTCGAPDAIRRRWQGRSYSASSRTWAGRPHPRGRHSRGMQAALTWPQRWLGSRREWPRPLKNRLARHRTPWRRTLSNGLPWLHGCTRLSGRQIHRTRSCLRSNHAARRRLWSRFVRCRRRRCQTRRSRIWSRNGRSRLRPRCIRCRRRGNGGGRLRRRNRHSMRSALWRHRRCSLGYRLLNNRRSFRDWGGGLWRWCLGRRSNYWRRGSCRYWSCGLGRSRRRCWLHDRRRNFCRGLFDGLQHIAGLRNLREIDLGLDFIGHSPFRPGLIGRSGFFQFSLEVPAHTFDLIALERTRVALLIVDADGRQVVEDCLAFNFQFSGQIVNANFFHSVLCCFLCFLTL